MFKTKIFVMSFVAVLGSTLIGLILSSRTDAANPEPVTVEVTFVAAITISETNALQFGLVDDALANLDTIRIETNDAVTESTPRILGPVPLSAKFNVTATPSAGINILVSGESSGAGYGLSNWECDYDGGTVGTCTTPGLSETSGTGVRVVRVGVLLTGDGTATAGPADGSFNLTIAYE